MLGVVRRSGVSHPAPTSGFGPSVLPFSRFVLLGAGACSAIQSDESERGLNAAAQWGSAGGMTTLPTDPPVDDDDWSHEQLDSSAKAPADPDDLDVYPEA